MIQHSGILLAYYSSTGNTREIAYQLHTCFDTCLYRIAPRQTYPLHWYEIRERVAADRADDQPMQWMAKLSNMDNYHTIFLGFPNWWNALPLPVERFLLEHNFSGKTILPFSTYKTNAGVAAENVKRLCAEANVLNALEIPDVLVKGAHPLIQQWIRQIPYLQTLKHRMTFADDNNHRMNN